MVSSALVLGNADVRLSGEGREWGICNDVLGMKGADTAGSLVVMGDADVDTGAGSVGRVGEMDVGSRRRVLREVRSGGRISMCLSAGGSEVNGLALRAK